MPTSPRKACPGISSAELADSLAVTCDPVEVGLLGRLLQAKNGDLAEIRDRIRSHHFYRERHALLYRTILELDASRKPTDQASVVQALCERGLLKKAGGAAFVSGVADKAGPAGSLAHYAATIRRTFARRKQEEILEMIRVLKAAPDAATSERSARLCTLTSRLHLLASVADDEEPALVTPLKPLRSYALTDAGNAEIIAALYADRLRYDHKRDRWLMFRGHRWHQDALEEINQLAKEAARARFADALNCKNVKGRKAVARWALSSEARSRLVGAIDLARSEPQLADDGEAWDSAPFLLGVRNGVIDLCTGELRAGRREDRITKAIPIEFDPKAQAPRWERFFTEVFRSDEALIDFVHRATGYSLTGSDCEQVLFLCHGSGANGKSTLLRVLRDTLGPYAWNTGFSTLESHAGGGKPSHSEDLANLAGRRLVTASETTDTSRLNEARVKALTGGDQITASLKYGHEFTFRPEMKFWLACNHRPRVTDTSLAFWRRVRLIPFRESFEGQEDSNLESTLRAEAPGILAWAVRGALEWHRRGLAPPESVTAATAEYRESEDQLAAFLAECAVRGEGMRAKAASLFEAYTTWADGEGLRDPERLGSRQFGEEMTSRFKSKRDSSGKWYFGLALKAEGEE